MSVSLRGKFLSGVLVWMLCRGWRFWWCAEEVEGGMRALRCRARALCSLFVVDVLVFVRAGLLANAMGTEGEGSWGNGRKVGVRSFQSRIQILALFLKPMDFLFEGLVLAGLFFVFGQEEGDFLLEGADGFFGFVGFDVGLRHFGRVLRCEFG